VSRAALLPWLLLTLWAVWIFALQAALGRSPALASIGPWVPDVGLVLALALAARLPTHDLPWVGLCVGLARASLSVDPPAAVIAGYLGAVAVARSFRSVVEIKSPPAIGLLAFLLALCLSGWLGLVHAQRAAKALGSGAALAVSISPVHWGGAWRGALATGLTAALLSAGLARLPGLSPLYRRKVWRAGASSR
jgi:hypothetical protein